MRGVPVASQDDVMRSQHQFSWMRCAMEDKTKSMEGLYNCTRTHKSIQERVIWSCHLSIHAETWYSGALTPKKQNELKSGIMSDIILGLSGTLG